MKLISFIILISLILSSCTGSSDNSESENSEVILADGNEITIKKSALENLGIRFEEVKIDTIFKSVRATGYIDVPPSNRAEISTLVGGRTTKINVIVGQRVSKGEIIAVLESDEYLRLQENFLKLFHQIPVLESEFERQQKLYDENIASEKSFLESKSSLNRANAEILSLENQLKLLNTNLSALKRGVMQQKLNIISPISGSVEKMECVLGHFMAREEMLFTVVNTEHLHLELNVFSKDATRVEKDQTIIYSVPTISNQQFRGEAYMVSQTLDETSRAIRVHGHIHEKDYQKLLPGMLVEASIVTEKFPGYNIPEFGIAKYAQDNFIFVVVEENDEEIIVSPVEVDLVGISGSLAQVNIDKEIDDPIITAGAFHIMNIWKGI